MRYTFEISYHHNNPTSSMRFKVDANSEKEALTKAYVRGFEHQFGETYGITEEQLLPLMQGEGYHIVRGDDCGETCHLHVWNQIDEHNGKKTWNRGFGIGGPEKDSTSKHENAWLNMVVKGKPKTKKELVQAIEGMVYDLSQLGQRDLVEIYNKLTAVSKEV